MLRWLSEMYFEVGADGYVKYMTRRGDVKPPILSAVFLDQRYYSCGD